MSKESLIFQPGKIGKLTIKNRLIMAAMGNKLGSPEGYITQAQIDYYAERAQGGVGMIVSQTLNVGPETSIPLWLDIHHDRFIDKLKELTDTIHRYDSKICAQIMMRTQTSIAFTNQRALLPSAVPFQKREGFQGMTHEEIDQLIRDFAEAARRAKDAGFDAVEFHCCHGAVCVIGAFLSSFTNRRTDGYGGSAENRARLACEIVASARQKVGPDFPLMLRLNGRDGIVGGNTIEDALKQAVLIEKAGIDAISVSSGVEPWSFRLAMPVFAMPRGTNVEAAALVKKALKVPVVVAGRIDYSLAIEILKEGKADFIGLGRPYLADPYLSNKWKAGKPEDVRDCLYCGNCYELEPRRTCTVNTSLYHEREYRPTPAPESKKVVVVGGGIGGMEAARILRGRGHRVTLYEKSGKLGGQFNIAALEKDKEHYHKFVAQLAAEIVAAGVDIRMNQEADTRIVKEQKPDAVIVAAGSSPAAPDIPGVNGKNVVQAVDIITGKARAGDRVAIIGGKAMGMEMAIQFARQGKKVCMITLGELGHDGRPVDRPVFFTLRHFLMEANVPVYQNAPAVEIKDEGLYFMYNNELAFVEADTIVLAAGVRPDKKVAAELKKAMPDTPVYEVGDCREPRNASWATNDAAEIAYKI